MGLHVEATELLVLLVSLGMCLAFHLGRDIRLNRRAHWDLKQLHATHDSPASRLGGVAIFASFLLTLAFFDGYFGRRLALAMLAMLPMIATTFWEDMVRPTPPRLRLAGVLASSVLTMSLLGVWLPRIDLPLVDGLMQGGFGVVLTIIFISVTVNGFNMIDGLNGLCAGTALAALGTMNYLSTAVGYEFMAHLSMSLAAAIAGFLILNFPRGRIFLGDTGSYMLGYLIALFGISICFRFPQVSPWAIFLILGYPLGDVGISFLRRLLAGASPFGADKLHFHHLVLSLLRRSLTGEAFQGWHNPIGTLLILPLAIAPMIHAAAYYNRPGMLQAGAVAYAIFMVSLYAALRIGTPRAEAPTPP